MLMGGKTEISGYDRGQVDRRGTMGKGRAIGNRERGADS